MKLEFPFKSQVVAEPENCLNVLPDKLTDKTANIQLASHFFSAGRIIKLKSQLAMRQYKLFLPKTDLFAALRAPCFGGAAAAGE